MIRQFELLEKVKAYDSNTDEDRLNRAYVYAMKAHGSQTRASGDPYFSHPLEVAGILSDLKLDSSSIAAALLHDTLEDTDATLEELEHLFGREVSQLVDGVTKLSKLEVQSEKTQQAENFRKLLLATSKDIRVLLIKLADRLHNMRTLHFVKKPEKRERIAMETMEIYAPLAARMGIDDFKNELQDLSFKQLHADARASILARLEFLRVEEGRLVDKVIGELTGVLGEHGVRAEVSGREKTPYSIWQKMQKKNVSFEQLADIMAFRVMVDDIPMCYQAMGILHSKYSVVPGRFKDYISTPKPNGYRSIHTVLIGPENQRIEVQIRTHEMHEIAELGVAAHWAYKQSDDSDGNEGQQYRWLRQLLDILEQAEGPQDFLEHTKLEMFEDKVFCFTPAGTLIELPKGATPVDFAYAVHSGVGDTCVGSRVNGRIIPLKTILQNGDQVEILTSKTQTPSPAWEQFVVTGKAKARIRRYVRTQQRAQYIDLGRSMLQRVFRKEAVAYSDKAVEQALKKLSVNSLDDLLVELGEGRRPAREVLLTVHPHLRETSKQEEPKPSGKAASSGLKPTGDGVPITGLIPGMAYRLAKCCHPLPGDRIVGIITSGRGVTIHTIDCDTLRNFSEQPERWVDVSWRGDAETESNAPHVARLMVVMQNEADGFGTLGTVIAKNEGHIQNLRITNRTPDFFELLVDVEVQNIKHLNNIIAALRASTAVTSVERSKN